VLGRVLFRIGFAFVAATAAAAEAGELEFFAGHVGPGLALGLGQRAHDFLAGFGANLGGLLRVAATAFAPLEAAEALGRQLGQFLGGRLQKAADGCLLIGRQVQLLLDGVVLESIVAEPLHLN